MLLDLKFLGKLVALRNPKPEKLVLFLKRQFGALANVNGVS